MIAADQPPTMGQATPRPHHIARLGDCGRSRVLAIAPHAQLARAAGDVSLERAALSRNAPTWARSRSRWCRGPPYVIGPTRPRREQPAGHTSRGPPPDERAADWQVTGR